MLEFSDILIPVMKRVAQGDTLVRAIKLHSPDANPSEFLRWVRKDTERLSLYNDASSLRSVVWRHEMEKATDGQKAILRWLLETKDVSDA